MVSYPEDTDTSYLTIGWTKILQLTGNSHNEFLAKRLRLLPKIWPHFARSAKANKSNVYIGRSEEHENKI